eukprot:12017-Heterococcus_DN1.PRE.2
MCSWPVGLVATILSCMSQKEHRKGNDAKAMKFSKLARNVAILSIVLGAITLAAALAGTRNRYAGNNRNNRNYNNRYNNNNNRLPADQAAVIEPQN